MPKFTSADHNGPAQLDSVLQQFREAALKQARPWAIDIESIDGTLMISGTVGPKPPVESDVSDDGTEILSENLSENQTKKA